MAVSIDNAIQINSLWKSYMNNAVLRGLSLQVPMGKIYGLLGPSGCGKTTLLKCVIGRQTPDSGQIRVMGQRPGRLGHAVPGHLIGYMPQELALYQEFSIAEILYYFGRIFCMPSECIEAQVNFLSSLLNLPGKNKLIGQISGGQQRRVSFACALLHKPPLLILDEPTVGVDPLLRQCIWYHLQTLVRNTEQPTSVVITTHYIEEARQGDLVALMRDGQILAESSPDSLLKLYKENTLEAVFLRLCRQNTAERDHQSTSEPDQELDPVPMPRQTTQADGISATEVAYSDEQISFSEAMCAFLTPPNPRRVLAVIGKYATCMRRRLGFLLFQLSLPVVQIVLFCICIGADPFGLRLAIVNGDGDTGLGAKFIQQLDNVTFEKVSYPDLTSAQAEVRSAKAWGLLHLDPNFTHSLLTRLLTPMRVNNASLSSGSVQLQLDNSNHQISLVVRKSVAEAFRVFHADLLSSRGLSPSLASLPVSILPPLLGSSDTSFTEFMAPGIIVTIIFFMATGLTSLSFVLERKEGLMDRSLVVGVTSTELMLGHMITELLIMTSQTAVLLLFSLAVFHITCHGSVLLVGLLVISSGLTGMSLGLLISVLCRTENSAIQAAIGTMYPSLLLSGIIWPVEAMPRALWHLSQCLPTTRAVEALRSVIGRGFDLSATPVWLGLVSTVAWTCGLLILALVLLRIKGL